jgi:hypothetical protein
VRRFVPAFICLLLTGCAVAGLPGSSLTGVITLTLLLFFVAACRPALDERMGEFWVRYLLRDDDDSSTPVCTGSQDYTQSFDTANVDFAAAEIGFTISGQNGGDGFGQSVAGAGDFNGDGIGDIIVGANLYNGTRGRAYLFFGRDGTGGDLAASDGVYFGTTTTTHYLGQFDSFSTAGDVNGDGYDDLLLGNYYYNSLQGRTYLIFGSANPTSIANLPGITASQGVIFDGSGTAYSGKSVAALGDINGDGLDDFAIGSVRQSGNGEASIIFGRTSGWSASYTIGAANITGYTGFTVSGEAGGTKLGGGVAPLGDINGDGIRDILVGAYEYNTNAGAGYVIYGATGTRSNISLSSLPLSDAYRVAGGSTYQQGRAAAGGGDFNGDGTPDFALGSRAYTGATGRVALLYGDVGTLGLGSLPSENGVLLDGSAAGVQAGSSLSMNGDVNGDGLVDLLVGSDRTTYNGAQSGSAFLLFGQTGITTNTSVDTFNDGVNGIRVDGPAASYNAGTSVDLSDVNGDGCADILVGAPNSGNGKVYVVFGGQATQVASP